MRTLSILSCLLLTGVLGAGCGQKATPPEADAASAPLVSASAPVASAAPSAAASHAAAPAVSAASSDGAAKAGAYDWTEEVTLSGTMTKKEVESSRGGSIQTPFLVLDKPISLRKGRPNTNETEVSGVREIWLGNLRDDKGKYVKADPFYGKKVSVQGHFQTSDTGHHHSHPWFDGKLVSAAAGASVGADAGKK